MERRERLKVPSSNGKRIIFRDDWKIEIVSFVSLLVLLTFFNGRQQQQQQNSKYCNEISHYSAIQIYAVCLADMKD